MAAPTALSVPDLLRFRLGRDHVKDDLALGGALTIGFLGLGCLTEREGGVDMHAKLSRIDQLGAGRNRQYTPMQISQFLALGRRLIADVSVDLLTHVHAKDLPFLDR